MNKMIIPIILGTIITNSCNLDKKEICGKYSFTGKNILDTLIINEKIYTHKIYNKKSKLMYQDKNTWSLEGDRINLHKFYNNEDNEILEPLSIEDAKRFLMLTSYPIYKNNKEILIEVNADENIHYKKIR